MRALTEAERGPRDKTTKKEETPVVTAAWPPASTNPDGSTFESTPLDHRSTRVVVQLQLEGAASRTSERVAGVLAWSDHGQLEHVRMSESDSSTVTARVMYLNLTRKYRNFRVHWYLLWNIHARALAVLTRPLMS
eukprot:1570363-Rhodomonas_salina.2